MDNIAEKNDMICEYHRLSPKKIHYRSFGIMSILFKTLYDM